MNIKKLDDKEVVFVDEEWTPEEKTMFSELLKKKQVLSVKSEVKSNTKVGLQRKHNSAA